jgi:hypothetical protein
MNHLFFLPKFFGTSTKISINPYSNSRSFLKICILIVISLLFLSSSYKSNAQDRWRPYLNLGYITNIERCADCTQADRGGSVRIGALGKGRFGIYAGYIWFNEYHESYIEYDDKGSGFMAGIDFLVLKRKKIQTYLKAGLFNEKFTSTYPSGIIDIEYNIKPDFGILLDVHPFNFYAGWQPSAPSHFNLGIGLTLFDQEKD